MADYQLTQTGDEVQDILDNSQTGKYFYNQSVATWSSDATYSDYPYKGVITLTGVKGTDGVEVTFSNADATSGNYSPICNTVANGVEIWAKAQDNGLIIPTIHITTGADVQLQGDDAYLPIGGGNITGSLSVVGSPVLTKSNILTTTVSGTTDENAFISTGLKSNDYAILGATDLYVNGTLYKPFFAIPLYRGTGDGLTTSLKLLTWARTDDAFKNVSVSLKIYYIAY